LFKIITDHEGETKITFCVPLSELPSAVELNNYLQKEIILEVGESDGSDNYTEKRTDD